MSDDPKRRAYAEAERAADLFERGHADEEKRRSDMLAKTARLRKLRFARDAAEIETEKDKAKPKNGRSS